MKKGFTLVELSITLVIIGLLIGGILIAQSLIESAQANRVISSLKQYDSMVALFKERYRQLPGDSTLFTNSGSTNNNGIIGDDSFTNSFTDEAADFWVHMSEAGMVDETYTSTVTGNINYGVNVPKLLDGGVLAGHRLSLNSFIYGVTGTNYFVVYNTEDTQSGVSFGTPTPASGSTYMGSLQPYIVVSIDNKIDDGVGWSGDILARYYVTNSDGSGGGGSCSISSSIITSCVLYYKMQYDD